MSGGRISAWPPGRQDHRRPRGTGREIGDLGVPHHGRDYIAGVAICSMISHGDEIGTLCIVGEFRGAVVHEERAPIGDRSS